MGKFLGVDCGGTSLRLGIVDSEGNLTQTKKIPSPLKTNPQSFAENIKGEVGDEKFEGIGIGVPGPLDIEKGLILPSSNLANNMPLEILTQFKSLFRTKVVMDRDAIVALMGEAWKGAAVGCKNVVLLTLGTGVGGAVMIDGEIDRGKNGKAGEIGHMIIDSESEKQCGLGHRGCLEAMINSSDELDDISEFLGIGLANIASIFNPEKIIIGGGKVAIGDFLPKALEIMGQNGIKSAVDEIVVEYAKLDEWSGVYGAAKLVIDKQ